MILMSSKFYSYLLIIFCLVHSVYVYGASEAKETVKNAGDARSHTVLVSINPHKFLIERLAGDIINIVVLVPPGANMHTFEPTPKQVMQASKADIWFRMGEMFEQKALSSLRGTSSRLTVADMRDGMELICPPQGSCAHCREGCDLHYWLDPALLKQQANKMALILTKMYPEHGDMFNQNLQKLNADLDRLDEDIAALLSPLKNRVFFVSHPAYGYFSKRYELTQIALEFEGKDPKPRQLTHILDIAKENNVQTIFIQKQFNNKGARLVASELGAKLVVLDPYADDLILEMRKIAREISRK